ncbi:inositol-3-phosphate synthase [Amblyomma americanum]
MVKVEIDSPTVRYTADLIEADYVYSTSDAKVEGNVCRVRPRDVRMTFRTKRRVPRLGVMLVGIGGNNGSTVVAATLANKLGLSWRTKDKVQVRAREHPRSAFWRTKWVVAADRRKNGVVIGIVPYCYRYRPVRGVHERT